MIQKTPSPPPSEGATVACRTAGCERGVEPLPDRTRCCLTCSDQPELQGVHLAWCEVRNGTHHSQKEARVIHDDLYEAVKNGLTEWSAGKRIPSREQVERVLEHIREAGFMVIDSRPNKPGTNERAVNHDADR